MRYFIDFNVGIGQFNTQVDVGIIQDLLNLNLSNFSPFSLPLMVTGFLDNGTIALLDRFESHLQESVRYYLPAVPTGASKTVVTPGGKLYWMLVEGAINPLGTAKPLDSKALLDQLRGPFPMSYLEFRD